MANRQWESTYQVPQMYLGTFCKKLYVRFDSENHRNLDEVHDVTQQFPLGGKTMSCFDTFSAITKNIGLVELRHDFP